MLSNFPYNSKLGDFPLFQTNENFLLYSKNIVNVSQNIYELYSPLARQEEVCALSASWDITQHAHLQCFNTY